MGIGVSANGGPFSSAWRATRARATGEGGSGSVGCKRESCRQYICAAHSDKRDIVSSLVQRYWPPVHLQRQRGVWWSESQTAEGAHVWYEFWWCIRIARAQWEPMTDNFPAYTSKVPAFLSRKSMAKLGHLAVRDCPAGQLPATRVGHICTVRPRRKEQTVAS